MKRVSKLSDSISSPQKYKDNKDNDENSYALSGWYHSKYIPTVAHSKVVSIKRLPLDLNYNRNLKRGEDILISALVITCVFPWLIPIVALLIKIDSRGPVFFLQKRNKRNGKVFTCIKFRSMIENEDADFVPAEENDKRITRIGKYLRRNHIDELPQFLNVLWGDMSVVGPRPHMISDNISYNECVNHYAKRLEVKPGITGLAQIMGYSGPIKSIHEMEKRVDIDNIYIRHWSLKSDLIISYKTIFKTSSKSF